MNMNLKENPDNLKGDVCICICVCCVLVNSGHVNFNSLNVSFKRVGMNIMDVNIDMNMDRVVIFTQHQCESDLVWKVVGCVNCGSTCTWIFLVDPQGMDGSVW